MKQFSVLLTFIFLVVTVYSQNQTRTTFTSPKNLLTQKNDENINWESGFQLPGVPATIVETYENDIIIGGDFSAIGSDTVNSVAIWNTFTERWYKLGNGLKYIDFVGDEFPGRVKDIIVDGIYIYVAGQFNQAINSDGSLVTVDNFAMWDGFEWIPFEANFNAPVEAIELDGFDLYMGGSFDEITSTNLAGTFNTSGLVKYNFLNEEFSNLANGIELNDPNFSPYVYTLSLQNNSLFIAGRFDAGIGSDESIVNSENIIEWRIDSLKWKSMDGGITERDDFRFDTEAVNSIYNDERYIYVGGSFTTAGSITANNIARWDTLNREWQPLNDGVDDAVKSVTKRGGNIYVGGYFETGSGLELNYIGSWNPFLGWEQITTSDVLENVIGVGSSPVHDLEITDDNVLVAAGVENVGKIFCNGLGLWDGNEWNALPGNGIGSGYVNSVVFYNNDIVFVGGNFNTAGSKTAWNIAKYDRSTKEWSSLGKYGLSSDDFNSKVTDMVIDGNDLYVVGDFDKAYDDFGNEVQAKHIARWNITGGSWSSVIDGLDFGSSALNYPLALEVNNNSIYLGGNFHEVNGIDAWNIIMYDGELKALDGPGDDSFNTSMGPGPNGIVYDLEFANGNLYVGGNFFTADTTLLNNIAYWDGTDWRSLGGTWGGADGTVYDLDVDNSLVYVGGVIDNFIDTNGETTANGVGYWDGSKWSALGNGLVDSLDINIPSIRSISVRGAEVFAAGRFTKINNGDTLNNAAKWDGTKWVSLGDGFQSQTLLDYTDILYHLSLVNSIATTDSTIFFGGQFEEAGSKASVGVAEWNEEINVYKVNIKVNPNEPPIDSTSVTPVTGLYNYQKGSSLDLSAHPPTGWFFSGWTGDVNSKNELESITVSDNLEITGNFGQATIGSISFSHLTPDGWRGINRFYDDHTVDGNRIRVEVKINNPAKSNNTVQLRFTANDELLLNEENDNGVIDVELDDSSLVTSAVYEFQTFSLAWQFEGVPQKDPLPVKVELRFDGTTTDEKTKDLKIIPKPVILVHGLWSNAKTWDPYNSKYEDTFLKKVDSEWVGLPVETMNTGSLTPGYWTTNTKISDNAKELQKFIQKIRKDNNASHVDLLAHSMGGLISRYYIHALMGEDVGDAPIVDKLVMLGTPNNGSACAYAALVVMGGLERFILNKITKGDILLKSFLNVLRGKLPKGNMPNNLIQLTPLYVENFFNKQITNLRDVNFYILAGNKLVSSCTGYGETDGVVKVSSALGWGSFLSNKFKKEKKMQLLHTSMTAADDVFLSFVKSILSRPYTDNGISTGANSLLKNEVTSADSKQSHTQMSAREIVVLPPNSEVEQTFGVNTATYLSVNTMTSPQVSSSLTGPSGSVIDEIAAGSDIAMNGLRTHGLENPSSGSYTVSYNNTTSDTLFALMSATINDSPLTFEFNVDSSQSSADPLINAVMKENGANVIADSIVVNLFTDLDTLSRVELYDDGNHNDGNANDGIFANTITSLPDGRYLISASAYYNNEVRYQSGYWQIGQGIDPNGADLGINIIAPTDTIKTDTEFNLEIEITNFGPQPAEEILLTAQLPDDYEVTNYSSSSGNLSLEDNQLTLAADALADKSKITLDLDGKFPEEGLRTISFSVENIKNDYDLDDNEYELQIDVGGLVVSAEEESLPEEYRLYQNYPNPFNPSTTISFDLPERTDVEINIYNILGQQVRTLINERMNAGRYKVNFNVGRLASGVYIYTIRTDKFVKARKMMILK